MLHIFIGNRQNNVDTWEIHIYFTTCFINSLFAFNTHSILVGIITQCLNSYQ